jgi:uncharacterized protein (TIGR02246 family)
MKRHAISSLVVGLVVATPAFADDKADVEAAIEYWGTSVADGCISDPNKIANLYAKDGVLWGTLSPSIRSDPAGIQAYFKDACTKLPKLTVEFKDHLVRVYGDTAIDSGTYVFSFEKDGAKTDLPARYTFVLVKDGGQWQIVDHHSSAMPKEGRPPAIEKQDGIGGRALQ